MSGTRDNKRQRLIGKFTEMFQMDQADLEFGICRIITMGTLVNESHCTL